MSSKVRQSFGVIKQPSKGHPAKFLFDLPEDKHVASPSRCSRDASKSWPRRSKYDDILTFLMHSAAGYVSARQCTHSSTWALIDVEQCSYQRWKQHSSSTSAPTLPPGGGLALIQAQIRCCVHTRRNQPFKLFPWINQLWCKNTRFVSACWISASAQLQAFCSGKPQNTGRETH